MPNDQDVGNLKVKVGLDTIKFNNGIAELGKKMAIIGQDFKNASGSLDKVGDASKISALKISELTGKIDIQKKIVAEFEKEHKRLADTTGANSKATLNYELNLKKAQGALQNMEKQLKQVTANAKKNESAFVSIGAKLDAASKKAKEFGDALSKTGKNMTVGITAPVLAAVAGLGALVGKALESASELQKMADVTGFTAERIQELAYVGKNLDMEFETLMGSQTKLTRGMQQAADGNKAQADSFKDLGINIKGADGHLRDAKEVMLETIDALGSMQNETERDALALKIFGKSAMELNPLIKAGSAEVAKLTAEARKNGAVMSDEAVAGLDEFGDSLESAKISIKTASAGIAVELIPTLKTLLPVLVDKIVPAIKAFVKSMSDMIEKFSALSPGTQTFIMGMTGIALAIGPALTLVGKLSLGFSALMTSLKAASAVLAGGQGIAAALGVLVGPAGLVVLAVAAVSALGLAFFSMKKDAEEATNKVRALVTTFDESSQAFQRQTDEISKNSDLTKDLSEELYALVDKENKSNAEKTKMTELVSQLNKLLPEMSLKIDAQTGKLNIQKQAISELIEAKRKELLIQANEEGLLKLYKEKAAKTADLAKAQERLTKAAEAYRKAKKDPGKIITTLEVKELKEAQEAVDLLNGSLKTIASETANAEEEYGYLATQISNYDEMIMDNSKKVTVLTAEELDAQRKKVEDISAAKTKIFEDALAQQRRDAQAAYDQQVKDYEAYNTAVENRTQEHISQMGSLEDAGIKKTLLTAAQVKKNLEKQIKDFQDWQAGIKKLATKVPEDVMAELIKLGPGMDPIIDDLNKMTPVKLNAWVATWRLKGAEAKKAAVTELSGLPGSMASIGANTGQGFVDGINSKITTIRLAAQAMARAVSGQTSQYLEIKSPSRVMERLGAFVPAGLANGIKNGLSKIKSAAAAMANASTPATRFNVPAFNVAGAAMQNMTINPIRMPSMDYSRPPAQLAAANSVSGLNQVQNMAETNALLRELLNGVRAQQRTPIILNDREVGEAVLPGVMAAGLRQNKQWPVKSR